MCDSLLEPDGQRKASKSTPKPHSNRMRIAGAVAAGLVAAVAVAGVLWPPQAPALSSVAPPATAVAAVRAIEQTAAGVDDGVPSGAEVAGSGERHCQHDM